MKKISAIAVPALDVFLYCCNLILQEKLDTTRTSIDCRKSRLPEGPRRMSGCTSSFLHPFANKTIDLRFLIYKGLRCEKLLAALCDAFRERCTRFYQPLRRFQIIVQYFSAKPRQALPLAHLLLFLSAPAK